MKTSSAPLARGAALFIRETKHEEAFLLTSTPTKRNQLAFLLTEQREANPMSDEWAQIKVPTDIRLLMKLGWFVTIEPPYWYLRCRRCGLRRHLPWDIRLRTKEAHDLLCQHGKQCAGHDVELAS